jgi:hypothetical protein
VFSTLRMAWCSHEEGGNRESLLEGGRVADTGDPRRKWRRAVSLSLDKGGVDEHFSRSATWSGSVSCNSCFGGPVSTRHHKMCCTSAMHVMAAPCRSHSALCQVCIRMHMLGCWLCSAHIEEKQHPSAVELVHEAEAWVVGAARRVPWVKVRKCCLLC